MRHGFARVFISRRVACPVLAGLALLAMVAARPPARASAAGTAVSQAGSPAAIVGLWLVSPYPDRPGDLEIATFDTGGFMYSSNAPSMAAMPGQGPNPTFGSSGFGLWQSQPDGSVAFKFLVIAYDQDGGYLGYVNIHGNLTLDPSVATFSGTYSVTFTSPDGSTFDAQGPTPVTGMRVGL